MRGYGAAARAVVAVLLTLAALAAGTGAAQAKGYRYWSFWQGAHGGGWTYATQGPAVVRPGDGDTVGFRFAVSEDNGSAAKPREAAGSTAVCAGTAPRSGTKRVAVVIDFGTAADAPGGGTPPRSRTACARVAADASAADALAHVAKPLRYNSDALLCAISGYPESGCAEAADHSSGKGGGGSGGDSGPSAGVIGGVAAVALLGTAAVWQARRRRT